MTTLEVEAAPPVTRGDVGVGGKGDDKIAGCRGAGGDDGCASCDDGAVDVCCGMADGKNLVSMFSVATTERFGDRDLWRSSAVITTSIAS